MMAYGLKYSEKKERRTMVVKYNSITPNDLGGGVVRRVMSHGGNMMAVEVSFKKGAVGDVHTHVHEQISYIVEGKFEFTMGDDKYILEKGDTYYVKPNIPHGVVALEDSVILDVFVPQREDFLQK